MFVVVSVLIALVCLTLVHRWATEAFPWLGRHRRALAAALALLFVEDVTTGWVATHWQSAFVDGMHTVCVVAVMALEMASIPILLISVFSALTVRASRLVARTRRSTSTLVPAEPPSPFRDAPYGPMTRRQLIEGAGGVAAIGASGAVLGWGAARGRHEFETCEVPVRIPGLPRALDGYVIVQISDLHVGRHVGDRDIEAGLELVRRARPDLLVVTGDIVDHDARLTPSIARKLADLPVRDGVAAILGNHDYYAGASEVVAALEAAGISALVNAGRLVRPRDGGGFALLGVDDRWSPRYGHEGPSLERALAAVPSDAPRILLSHQPPTVRAWAGRVALQLSGHTHGGQINPGFRPADLFFPYVAGAYQVEGTMLYVNRGFGTVGPPSRVGAPPEVTRLVLVSA
jgi:predicted MPP superfamily phosphohydrolase